MTSKSFGTTILPFVALALSHHSYHPNHAQNMVRVRMGEVEVVQASLSYSSYIQFSILYSYVLSYIFSIAKIQ